MTHTLTRATLAQFSGSETCYRHAFDRAVVFTEGAKHVADAGGAYWLLDEIVLAQQAAQAVAVEPFQRWRLTVAQGRTAQLACDDGNGNAVFTKHIAYTDFPLDSIDLYFIEGTILLPGEY